MATSSVEFMRHSSVQIRGGAPDYQNYLCSCNNVHPNQVSVWKRQAVDGLDAVFSNGAEKASADREVEIHDLHAKIGQLTVERDFLARGLKR